MDKEYFLNAGIPPPLHFEPTMHAWNSFSSAQEQLNCLNPNWDKQNDHYAQLESALSSMVSSPVAPASVVPNDAVALRELIGKLGPICNSGEISPPFASATTTAASTYVGNDSSNTSCYSTPLNSPPKLQVPILNQYVKENLPNLANSVALKPPLPALSADPGFAERAAKFSCFGSRSFNSRTSQFGLNNSELPFRSSPPMMGKLPRVSSSPALKQGGSPPEIKNSGQPHLEIRSANGLMSASDNKFSKLLCAGPNSNEESSVTEQVPSGEARSKTPNEINSRKRKAASRGKAKEDASNEAIKGAEADAEINAKRSKTTESSGSQKDGVKSEEEGKDGAIKTGDEQEKQDKANQKPPEPPKDYIHVRARRGQATDSHSLAERVRREKISERMKLLQDLVPGCNKVTGKALMLDEIINYVQSLQRQVEFLSMKLASVNPRLEFNTDHLTSKDALQPNASLPHQLYPVDSSVPVFYGHQPQQSPQPHPNATASQCSVDPVDTRICRNLGVQLPPVDGFSEGLPQFPPFSEDDLQSIVQMGFSQNPEREAVFSSQSFPVTNQTSHMKIDL